MVFFNYTTMQMTAKIVYYGPGLCGKTTNLQYIHHLTDPSSRGEMVSLETEADRTLFFDLLPLEVGVIGGMRVRLQLYTVPGQVFYNTTRKLVLKGVDGIVFVADSQVPALDANLESFENLQQNLEEMNQSLRQVPFVFQFNKRDLRHILPVDVLNRSLNDKGYEVFEAAALHGVGVFETLKAISKKTLASVHRKVSGKEPLPQRVFVPQPSLLSQSGREPSPARGLAGMTPLEQAVLDRGTEEVRVEFAAGLDVSAPSVRTEPAGEIRKIATRSRLDVERELEKLRRLARGESARAPGAKTKALSAEAAPKAGEGTLARTVKVKLPRKILERAPRLAVDLRLAGGDSAHALPDALKLDLPENPASGKVKLQITFDLEGEDS